MVGEQLGRVAHQGKERGLILCRVPQASIRGFVVYPGEKMNLITDPRWENNQTHLHRT